jgi:hypothetical protein
MHQIQLFHDFITASWLRLYSLSYVLQPKLSNIFLCTEEARDDDVVGVET